MKLNTQKTLEQLKPVLKNPDSVGPDPVYFVFQELPEGQWANITMIQNGKIGEEYPKTFGHYHSDDINETYHVVAGEGVLQLMEKYEENGNWEPKRVKSVYLVKAKPGEEIIITPQFGHSWSNIGNFPLISFDNWRSGHQPSDYEPVEKLQGLAYYLVEENGEPKAIPNPNYTDLPEPIWVTAEEFSKLQK